MFKEISPISKLTVAKSAFGKVSQNKSEETKKCKNCLKRIDLKYEKCPYCGKGDFQFNDS